MTRFRELAAGEEDTDQELEDQGRVLLHAEELFRIARNLGEQAQKLKDQAERSAPILAAHKRDRVKK